MPMPRKTGAASAAMTAALVLLAAAPASWAQHAPKVLVIGPMFHIEARLFIGGVSQGIRDEFKSGDPANFPQIFVKNAVTEKDAAAVLAPAIAKGIDAIVTIYGQSTLAARAATKKIPIIFCPVADPVAEKLAVSNDAPGGNLTGVSSADAEASRRRLEAFRRVVPRLKRLAVLFDPGFPPDVTQMKSLRQVAPSTGITLVSRSVKDGNTLMAALKGLGPQQADAIFVLKDATMRNAGVPLKQVAIKQKLPILVGDTDLITFPAVLAAVGPDQLALGRTCGRMTAQILKGARPATLAVEHPVFKLLLNLNSARRLGITIPGAPSQGNFVELPALKAPS